MYPSNQPTTSFCNYNHENHSKPSQDHSLHLYNYPHYNIPLGDEPMNRELFEQQQQPISNHNSYHEAGVVAHEYSTRYKTTNAQPAMENSNYDNNGKFGTVDGKNRFNNSHSMILENNGLMGNKRSSKKDRHSKINTARGPRDRRMRLSLDVAKKFFRLQDMLGFDKASNTIEWLLMKSKHAIQDLLPHQQLNPSSSLMAGGSSNSASSASECEVLSAGFDDQSIAITDKGKSASCSSNKEKKRLGRKSAHDHSLAKETREKARARARKRTTEKINNNNLGGVGCNQYSKFKPSLDQIMDQNVNRLGSCISFRENEVQTNQPQNPIISSRFPLLNKQGVVNYNASAIPGSWSPSSFFNYQHNPLSSNVHDQLSEFPILRKPWEGN